MLFAAAVGMRFAADAAAAPITIGFPTPLSGVTAIYGHPVLQGAKFSVSQINASGGVLGRKLELLPRDSARDVFCRVLGRHGQRGGLPICCHAESGIVAKTVFADKLKNGW
jgi:hypothetical protein